MGIFYILTVVEVIQLYSITKAQTLHLRNQILLYVNYTLINTEKKSVKLKRSLFKCIKWIFKCISESTNQDN